MTGCRNRTGKCDYLSPTTIESGPTRCSTYVWQLALPFAFVGVSWICFLTDSPFNLMAQIGLLILVGIVVNNGIVLMTTGLLPLAMGQNDVGDLLYFPLARTVIGGLAASTLLTLILVPCLYTLLEDGTRLVGRVWAVGPRRA